MSSDKWACDFIDFVERLQTSGLIARNPNARRAFHARFHKELAFVSLYLNELSVTGGEAEKIPVPTDNCDFCGTELSKVSFYVDGETSDGTWGNMCPGCYADHGSGIGWGIGQLYRQRKTDQWICIAGGNPEPESFE